jgi:hypothetical protein
MQLKNYKIFAEAYSTLDAESLIGALADDCVFESQMVLTALEGKKAIGEYLRGKFETICNANAHVSCSLERVVSGPVWGAIGKPCIVMHQGEQRAVVLLDQSNDGKITRIDLCIAPTPDDTEPLTIDH